MKQIFDWLREQMQDWSDNVELCNGRYADIIEEKKAIDLINEAEAKFVGHAICYLDSPCEYQNEDIRVDEVDITCCEWKKIHHYRFIYSPHEKNQGIWEEELVNKPFCPYCGKPIKISEVE